MIHLRYPLSMNNQTLCPHFSEDIVLKMKDIRIFLEDFASKLEKITKKTQTAPTYSTFHRNASLKRDPSRNQTYWKSTVWMCLPIVNKPYPHCSINILLPQLKLSTIQLNDNKRKTSFSLPVDILLFIFLILSLFFVFLLSYIFCNCACYDW